MPIWEIEDRTSVRHGTPVGYLSLRREGVRVCDFFPFAANTDEGFIRQQAGMIAALLNKHAPQNPGDAAAQEGGNEQG